MSNPGQAKSSGQQARHGGQQACCVCVSQQSAAPNHEGPCSSIKVLAQQHCHLLQLLRSSTCMCVCPASIWCTMGRSDQQPASRIGPLGAALTLKCRQVATIEVQCLDVAYCRDARELPPPGLAAEEARGRQDSTWRATSWGRPGRQSCRHIQWIVGKTRRSPGVVFD
jgi:hypothetical protein